MRGWWHDLSLRKLLIGSFILLMVFTLALMAGGTWWLFRRSLMETAGQARIDEVQALWRHHPAPPPPPRFRPPPGMGEVPDLEMPQFPPPNWVDLFTQMLATHNQGVSVWDDRGRLLAAAGDALQQAAPAPETFHLAHKNSLAYAWTAGDREFVLIPIENNFVELDNPRTLQDRHLEDLTHFMLSVAGFAVLLGGLAGAILARLLSRPLERLSTTAATLAGGTLEVRSGLPSGENEVLQVANAFDRMGARVQEAFTAQGRFVADASHELRTPLTTISGLAEVLETEGDAISTEKRERALQRIVRETDRMESLISDLLLLSSLDARPREAPESLPLEAVLREEIDRIGVVAPDRPIDLKCEPGLQVRWEEDALSRVVGNLLQNAVKYSNGGSAIRLSATRAGDRVRIQVEDHGSGIAPEDLRHVCDRFYRADRSRNRKTGGSGLGLAIVKSLVDAHGGTLHFDSVVGQGTTVTLEL